MSAFYEDVQREIDRRFVAADERELDSLNGLTDDPMDQAKSHKLRMEEHTVHFSDDPYGY